MEDLESKDAFQKALGCGTGGLMGSQGLRFERLGLGSVGLHG